MYFYSLSDDLPIGTNGYNVQRYIPTTIFDGSLYSIAETTAAGNGHPGDCDGADIVELENLCQLLGIFHSIQLGAADQRYFALYEILVKVTVGIGGAVSRNQQIRTFKIRSIRRHQLDLNWEVG